MKSTYTRPIPKNVLSPEYLAKLEQDQRAGTRSPMPAINSRMPAHQLTDIVTFLHEYNSRSLPPKAG